MRLLCVIVFGYKYIAAMRLLCVIVFFATNMSPLCGCYVSFFWLQIYRRYAAVMCHFFWLQIYRRYAVCYVSLFLATNISPLCGYYVSFFLATNISPLCGCYVSLFLATNISPLCGLLCVIVFGLQTYYRYAAYLPKLGKMFVAIVFINKHNRVAVICLLIQPVKQIFRFIIYFKFLQKIKIFVFKRLFLMMCWLIMNIIYDSI